MEKTIPEKDWKYLRSIQPGLLSSLCERINRKALDILKSRELPESEKYRKLFQHVQASDEIVARCFDDWRRSNIHLKIIALCQNNLLREEHLRCMSAETREPVRRTDRP